MFPIFTSQNVSQVKLKYSHILNHFQFVLLEFANHRNKKSSCCTRLFLTREFSTKSSFLKSLSYDTWWTKRIKKTFIPKCFFFNLQFSTDQK